MHRALHTNEEFANKAREFIPYEDQPVVAVAAPRPESEAAAAEQRMSVLEQQAYLQQQALMQQQILMQAILHVLPLVTPSPRNATNSLTTNSATTPASTSDAATSAARAPSTAAIPAATDVAAASIRGCAVDSRLPLPAVYQLQSVASSPSVASTNATAASPALAPSATADVPEPFDAAIDAFFRCRLQWQRKPGGAERVQSDQAHSSKAATA